jgi:biopolymer transport protein ExbD
MSTAIDAPSSAEPARPSRHARQRREKRHRALSPSTFRLNLTPMIDVIFLLLVYFVITANFAVGEGVLTAHLPVGASQPSDISKPPQQPLTIVIGSSGVSAASISVEGRRVETFTQLRALLEDLQYDPELMRDGVYTPDNPVIIQPDGEVRWQHVVNAFNAAITERYSNVSFARNRPEDEP